MSTLAEVLPRPASATRGPGVRRAVTTLAGRRFALTVRTPRELVVPLVTPVLFALVIAPALKTALHTSAAYESYVAIGTVGLLVPLNAMFLGIGSIVDRISGARRELLAAPVPRGMLVLGNIPVALATTGLQVGVLIGCARARGIHFRSTDAHVVWFVAAVTLLTLAYTGIAETLATRTPHQEEYIARVPAIAIAPWFLAGSLYPIAAMPAGLTWIAKFLPLTHGLALMRYGLRDDPAGLHAVWGTANATAAALLSLAVLTAYAGVFVGLAIRIFSRSATD